ncbi:hypothetical protein CPC16_003290 [Podila verticillata]|nr:hypothetical protein CPC16_003290 [Podila verticillata]KAI9231149.1 MAG: hypothetical protein BYD32DRAFT_467432 [Podila humilis]
MVNSALLPEVVLLVTEYFTPSEATAPSLVCRAWHDVFAGVIWRHYMIRPRCMSPSIATLTKNAHRTRKLVYFGTQMAVEDDLAVPYTRLTHLRFHGSDYKSARVWDCLAQLITRNQQLQEVTISDHVAGAQIELGQALASLPALRVLEMRKVCMDLKHWETIWNGCKSIRELRLFSEHTKDASTFNEEALEMHTELQSIALHDVTFFPLLGSSPNLRRVSWEKIDDSTILLEELTGLLLDGKLCQLECLKIPVAEDQPLASTLKAMSQVKELSLEEGSIGTLAFKDLTQHFATLQILSIPTNSMNASILVPTVLASCPLLTSITAPTVSATDLIHGAPWVCSRLKVFTISIEITDTEGDAVHTQSREIFRRLSKLEHLTELRVHGLMGENEPTFQGLDMRLESGLGQLSSLQHLWFLDFSDTIQNMSAEDVAWIRSTWRRIGHVFGMCNSQYGVFEGQPLL